MNASPSAIVVPPDGGRWISWLGGPIRYVATGNQTDQTYCASTGTVAPGAGAPPHRHGFHEGFYVTEGEVTFYAGSEKVRLGKGDFINIGAGTVHHFANESDTPAQVLTIAAPAGFDRFQMEAGERIGSPEQTGTVTKEEIVGRMRAIASQFGIELEPGNSTETGPARITVRRAGEGKSIGVVGDVYTFLADDDDTDKTYALWHAVVYPGGGPPPHLHRFEEEAFFILSGEVTFYADGQRHPSGPGTFVALPRNGVHSFRNEGTTPAEMLILVAPAGIGRMFEQIGKPWSDRSAAPPLPTPEDIEHLLRIAPSFGVEIQSPPAP